MAMPGFGQQQADQVRALKADVKTLLLQQLKDACKLEKLPVSGNKALLQSRLTQHIDDAQLSNSAFQLHSIKNSLRGIASTGLDSSPYPSPYSVYTSAASASPSHHPNNPKMPGYGSHFGSTPNQRHPSSWLRFRDSPFYTIIKSLTEVTECKIRETTRDTAKVKIQLAPDVTERIQSDSNVRVMVFCASESHTSHNLPQDITFPHQVELKCNDLDVKGTNLRGLKNKPGSTRPADITSMLQRKVPFANNALEMIYALTTKGPQQKFYLVVNLVMKKPVERLVADLRDGKAISKDRVLSEMRSKALDPDIVATSTDLSLKCPLSYMRIQTPCRGSSCSHNQCFDATSYLQLQEQAPTWTCPLCNKSVLWENLVLDHYVSDILASTSKDTEQVTIEPDGRWHARGQETDHNGTVSRASRPSNPTPSDDDDDDLIEIKDNRVPFRTQTQPKTLTPTPSSIRTPSINSRAASSTPMIGGSTSRKRPHSDVIDLTLSDDEEPMRPVKSRPSMSSVNGGVGNGSYRAGVPEYTSQPQQAASAQRYQFQLPPLSPPSGFDFYSRNGNGVNGGSGF